jgi:hypothetical protein
MDKIFEVEIEFTRRVYVRLPVDDPEVVRAGETAEDVAEEIALGGKEAWPQYVSRQDEDYDVLAVREAKQS